MIEVASDSDNFRFVTEVSQGALPLYRTTEKNYRFFYTIYAGSHQLEIVTHARCDSVMCFRIVYNISQGFFRASLCNTVRVNLFWKTQGIRFFVCRGAQSSYGGMAKCLITVRVSSFRIPKNIQDISKISIMGLSCTSHSAHWVTNGTFRVAMKTRK